MDLEEEVLLKEHDRVGTALMTLYVALERGMALAFGVAGLTAAFGKGHVAAVFLPILLGVIVLYVLDHLNEIMVLGGYKIFLEKRLNYKLAVKEDGSSSACGRLAQWDSWIAPPFSKNSVIKMGIWVTFGLVIAGGIVTSIVASMTYDGPYSTLIKTGVVLFWALFMVIVPLATWRAATVQSKVVEWAEYAPQETQWSPALFRQWKRTRKSRGRVFEEIHVSAAGPAESNVRMIDISDDSQAAGPAPQTGSDRHSPSGAQSGSEEHEVRSESLRGMD